MKTIKRKYIEISLISKYRNEAVQIYTELEFAIPLSRKLIYATGLPEGEFEAFSYMDTWRQSSQCQKLSDDKRYVTINDIEKMLDRLSPREPCPPDNSDRCRKVPAIKRIDDLLVPVIEEMKTRLLRLQNLQAQKTDRNDGSLTLENFKLRLDKLCLLQEKITSINSLLSEEDIINYRLFLAQIKELLKPVSRSDLGMKSDKFVLSLNTSLMSYEHLRRWEFFLPDYQYTSCDRVILPSLYIRQCSNGDPAFVVSAHPVEFDLSVLRFGITPSVCKWRLYFDYESNLECPQHPWDKLPMEERSQHIDDIVDTITKICHGYDLEYKHWSEDYTPYAHSGYYLALGLLFIVAASATGMLTFGSLFIIINAAVLLAGVCSTGYGAYGMIQNYRSGYPNASSASQSQQLAAEAKSSDPSGGDINPCSLVEQKV